MKKLICTVMALVMILALAAPAMAEGETYKVGICNYVDDASLNQIVENIQTQLAAIGEVEAAFRSIAGCLGRGGVFIFDMNTPYKHRAVLGDNTFVYDLPEVYAVWQNSFRESDCSVGITLDLFGKTESGYQRHTERFREKAYPKSAVLGALRRAGFRPEAVFDELKSCAPGPRTERILYVARRI